MSQIKDLPGAGHNFRATVGAGSFAKKFKSATVAGNLSNLKDNRQAILKTVKQHEGSIRLGKFDRLRQIDAWKKIKAIEGNKLTKDDAKEIKQIFKHLGSRQSAKEDDKPKVNMARALDKDTSYEEQRWAQRKAKVSALMKAGRFDRRTSGGDTQLKFASRPQATDRPENLEGQQISVSEKLLKRRFLSREERFKERLPRYTAQYDKEKEKRFEVSSLDKKSKDAGGPNDKKLAGPPPSSFQNL